MSECSCRFWNVPLVCFLCLCVYLIMCAVALTRDAFSAPLLYKTNQKMNTCQVLFCKCCLVSGRNRACLVEICTERVPLPRWYV